MIATRREVLSPDEPDGLPVAVRSDAFLVHKTSERVTGLMDSEANVSRLRLLVEGSRRFEAGGGTLGISKEESREMVAALGVRVSEAAESLRLRPDGLRVTVTDLVQHRAERASRLLEEPSAARPEKQRPRPTRADCR